MNHEDFAVIFGLLAEYFGATPSEGITETYFQAFQKWSDEDFKRACQIVIQNRIYNGLPKIIEITEALQGKEEDRTAIAFQTLIDTIKKYGDWESIIFEDGAISRTIETMGGWIAICGWPRDEWKFRRKDFDSIYLANFRRGNINQIRLPGQFELENAKAGFKDDIPAPVFVPDQFKKILRIEDKTRLLESR